MSTMANPSCPKCGAMEGQDGPRWIDRGPDGTEALVYFCRVCGAPEYKRTLDKGGGLFPAQMLAEDLTRRIAEVEAKAVRREKDTLERERALKRAVSK